MFTTESFEFTCGCITDLIVKMTKKKKFGKPKIIAGKCPACQLKEAAKLSKGVYYDG